MIQRSPAPQTATRYVIDQINAAGGWNGEPVQLVEYDNQGGPAGASDKVKAALADCVQLIIQGSSSAVSGQITEDVRKFNLRNPGKEVVFLNVGGEALELTGEKCHFHHFRFNPNAQVRVKALVSAMKEDKGLGTKVYSINQNYSWGHDMEASIIANAAAGGYQVVEKTLHDVNKIQDFSPYVAKIAASKATTVMTGNWSHDRHLLRATCDELWLVADGKVVPFDGDLDDYADWLAKARGVEKTVERDKAPPSKPAAAPGQKKATPATKKPEQERERLEQQIAGWQAELKLLEARLADPVLYAGAQAMLLAELGQRQSLLTQNIDAAESRWLELHEQLEALEEE